MVMMYVMRLRGIVIEVGGRSGGCGGRHLPFYHFLFFTQSVFLLEAFPASKETSVFKHIVRVWIKGPVTTFSRLFVISGDFHEALVQAQIVSDAILPTLFVVSGK